MKYIFGDENSKPLVKTSCESTRGSNKGSPKMLTDVNLSGKGTKDRLDLCVAQYVLEANTAYKSKEWVSNNAQKRRVVMVSNGKPLEPENNDEASKENILTYECVK